MRTATFKLELKARPCTSLQVQHPTQAYVLVEEQLQSLLTKKKQKHQVLLLLLSSVQSVKFQVQIRETFLIPKDDQDKNFDWCSDIRQKSGKI